LSLKRHVTETRRMNDIPRRVWLEIDLETLVRN
jgi:hypothetical protein